ncbi:MAG: PEGA domain-containing protein [Candidatus Competibacter sp.]
MALAFGMRGAFSGEAWLAITSEPPGATIAVDNTYRGVTPQHPDDTLRI